MSERAIADPGALGWVETSPGFWEFSSGGEGIKEAPVDSKQYARQDAAWSEVVIPDLVETDPTVPSHVKAISTDDIANWDSASIQDGDTEGQITTWDGTEWTPEGAVVVADGNVGIGSAPLGFSGTRAYIDGQGEGGGFEIHSGGTRNAQFYSSPTGAVTFGSFTDQISFFAGGGTKMTIDANGDINITGKLFINGEEVTAGGASLWTDNGDGTITANYVAKATNFQTL